MIDGKNLSPEQMKKAMNKLNISPNQEIGDYIKNNLSGEQANIINKFLNDKDAANRFLATPQAQKVLEKLLGKE